MEKRNRLPIAGNVAPEPRIPRAVDFAHPAAPERRDHFIRPEANAGRKRHDLGKARRLYNSPGRHIAKSPSRRSPDRRLLDRALDSLDLLADQPLGHLRYDVGHRFADDTIGELIEHASTNLVDELVGDGGAGGSRRRP